MKRFFSLLLLALLCLPFAALADSEVNLTPLPRQMTKGEGRLVLPQSFVISTGSLADSLAAEAVKFAKLFSEVTGHSVEVKAAADDALIVMSKYDGTKELGCEGYSLDITANGIAVAANCSSGFYYAFQSIKKMLPANVMAEVQDASVTEYSLPVVKIIDAPRFEYRGFMLDVSRHYFSIDQIKRLIDVMSYYKLNRFHWHLTDDQGWRFEVKKYPRLTTVGATRDDSWSTHPEYGLFYTGEPYGPYFYTQDECREIVAYAAERHIEVVPEIEFPGHSCAVNAAYPELSCNPNGAHSVKVSGGIFSDVLNVASPLVMQFAKDVLDEVIEVFPYSQIHIGGDETPTNAWQSNAECQAMMKEKGFTNIRQLQSYFVRQLSDYVTQKEGDKKRTVIMWNESLTAGGTDEEMIKGTGGTMMCWEIGNAQPCALKAANYGMKSIITTQVPYYINRRQSTDADEPKVAGAGTDNVEAVYNYMPIPSSVPSNLHKYYVGVQGTFWTEHVEDYGLLEYLALPRLTAIAETGWTQQNKKNFADFQQRITKDTLLLNYNNYKYGRHYILGNSSQGAKVMPVASTDEKQEWYRIVTTATDSRAGRCIQLLRDNSNEIGTGNARAGRLWNSAVIEDENNEGYDYQLWAFMQDPENPERWALVNKARPNGSVNGTPTAENNTGRWDYDESKRHYDFILGDKAYSQNGDNYNYSIRSQKVSNVSMCMNYAGPGQNNSINLWSDPADGNGGIWEFRPLVAQGGEAVVVEYPAEGTVYRIVNNTERFKGWSIYDNGNGAVAVGKQQYGADLWVMTNAEVGTSGQSFKLKNAVTGRYISSTAAPVALGVDGVVLTNVYNEKTADYSIKAGEGALYPLSERVVNNPNTLAVGGVYPQGTGWVYEKAFAVTYTCTDESGNLLLSAVQSAAAGKPFTAVAPRIENYSVVSYETTGTADAPAFDSIDENKVVNVSYKRTSYSVTYSCYTIDGNHIANHTVPCTIGEEHIVALPQLEFFTCVSSNCESEKFTPTEDTVINVYYETEGIMGSAGVGTVVTEIEDGNSYLIYNAKNETSRSGFLSVTNVGDGITTTNGVVDAHPGFVWTLNSDGNNFTVVNNYGVYIPTLLRGSLVRGSNTAEPFTFTLNADGKSWSVKGTGNNYYWNGNADNTFTGWDDGHPFILYNYKAHPYFCVAYRCVDEQGNELATGSRYVKGGADFSMLTPIFDGYTFKESSAVAGELARVTGNVEFTLTYTNNSTAIHELKGEGAKMKGIYDLTGRKVKVVTTPGIYIVDGEKVFVK